MFKDTNKLVVFGSQLVGVIIVVVGLSTERLKLHSPRPPLTKTGVVADSDEKADFFARLWDDPLELAARQTKAPLAAKVSSVEKRPLGPTANASPTPAAALPTPPQSSTDPNNLVIWNILDASSVTEIREHRLRIRYAVVSAVLTAGYLPLRESLLTRLADEYSEVLTEPGSKEKLIGSFETFVARSEEGQVASKKLVTLVWTGKEVPLDWRTIDSVKWQIARTNKDNREPELHVLHHGSSEDLVNYVAASKTWPYLETSFMRATIPTTHLGNKPDSNKPESNKPEPEPWRSCRITTDDVLVDALVRELSLRIPALNRADHKPSPRIVVITESDTNYSRAIYQELEKKFQEKCTGKADLEFCSYLRGLDGRSENDATTAESSKPESRDPVDLVLQGRGIAEKSSGTSQFDYLRRLALRLGSETKKRNGRDVVAVGILGSDIYDKMLVLQAVRPELPSAIFFTTDLDAIYLEQENQPFTRNLVVASADSLDASKKLPPMRDSYQTVLAKKILELLHEPTPGRTPTPEPARVFEIALGRSIALDASDGDGSFVLRHLANPGVIILIFCLALGNAFLVLAAVFTRKADPDPESTKAKMNPGAHAFVYTEVGVALIGIGYLLFQLVWSEKTLLLGEPLALGVSIWPSVAIRLLAFLVAILLLLVASLSFVGEGKGLREKLREAVDPEIALPLAQGFGQETVRVCRNLILEDREPPPDKPFDHHLDRFFGSGGPVRLNSRLWKIIGISTAYFVFSAFLFWACPPSVPGRGAFALLVDKIVLALGVSLYIVHLIFCLYLHFGAFTLIKALTDIYLPMRWQQMSKGPGINGKSMLKAMSRATSIIGTTLLYPLTVLILIILSRLRNFDNWVMTPSLTITFSAGALVLVTASLVLWLAGSRLKKEVLEHHGATSGDDVEERTDLAKEKEELEAIKEGVFAAWYNQPIFAAIFSAAAVFGSLSVAGPLARLFFG